MKSLLYLLLSLLLLITAYHFVDAAGVNHNNITTEDLLTSSKNAAFSSIKLKYLELQKMLSLNQAKINETYTETIGNSELKIFVSTSMSLQLLKAYVTSARKFKAVIVLNGLPDGSWKKLSELVANITEGEEAAIQIDDEAFKRFGITQVPSFVLTKNPDLFNEKSPTIFDKVTGNIGIRSALELFVSAGDLKEDASRRLSCK